MQNKFHEMKFLKVKIDHNFWQVCHMAVSVYALYRDLALVFKEIIFSKNSDALLNYSVKLVFHFFADFLLELVSRISHFQTVKRMCNVGSTLSFIANSFSPHSRLFRKMVKLSVETALPIRFTI